MGKNGWAFRILLVMCTVAAGFSQNVSSSVNGVLVDPTGSAIVDAACKLINQATGAKLAASSGPEGRVTFPIVQAGTYTLRVEAPAFTMVGPEKHTAALQSQCKL